jgi:hypothetical protein
MSDETTTTPVLPAPAGQLKPEGSQPVTSPADAASESSATATASQQAPKVTRAPTRVARGVTRKGAPNAVAAAKPTKTASPAKEKIPDYRKLTLNADDVIGGVRKVNPWKEATKGHGYYAKYRNGMTVSTAVKAGVPRGYIRWDVAHGFITLKSEG